MKNAMTLFFLFLFGVLSAQNIPQQYDDLVRIADSLYNAKDYPNSALKYSAGFKTNSGKAYPNDRYNAACSWALAGVPDSAFYHLYRLANTSNYSNYAHITMDQDLISLYKDPRWQPLLDIVKANKDKAEANLNKPLVLHLDSIFIEDQTYRKQIDVITEKYGRQSPEMTAHWKIINEKDSINLIKVTAILDKYGWLGPDVVGNQGSSTLFLVIQHSDIATQLKYLPMMREAVKNGKATGSSLALLEDRVALRQGKRQIYGSQIGMDPETNLYIVSPLDDPEHVDERRAAVGLQPLSDYVSRWKIKWDAEQYKKDLPALELKLNGGQKK